MPSPKWKEKKLLTLKRDIKNILETLGYNLQDENIKDTPKRVARLWLEELYRPKPTRKLFQVFEEPHDQMITLIGHKTFTRCPHHFERVKLIVSVGYIPAGYILGLSKLARIADFYAKGLVLQENYTDLLAEGLYTSLQPKGVGVHVLGEHQCMQARGVKTSGFVLTASLKGDFLDPATRQEFLSYCPKEWRIL